MLFQPKVFYQDLIGRKNNINKSLYEVNPKLTIEWHPMFNSDLKPMDVSPYSNKKVWWRCSKGHDWSASVANRSKGDSCPYCSGKRVIPGQTDLSTLRPDLAAEWNSKRNGELNAADVSVHSKKNVYWLCKKGHEWSAKICNRSNGNDCPYCSGKRVIPGETNLSTLWPELAAEWHPTRNGKMKASDFSIHSGKKVWWRCSRGHEWRASVNHRSQGTGCPYCIGKRVIPGETDLVTLRPDLAKEWHPTLNGTLNMLEVSVLSGKKVYWQCKEGHEWQSTVCHRCRGDNCPYCSGRRVIPGKTDLATLRPELATEWHKTRNRGLKASEVSVLSGKKVYWQCKEGHEWQATVCDRSKGSNCPYCSGRLVVPGKTDLATLRPDLAKEWHPTQNRELKPTEVSVHSNKKVYWQCKEGHEWQTTVNNRSNGNDCPYCAGKRVIPGETDLTTIRSDLAMEWHPTKNGELKPTQVSVYSNKKVYWQCKESHEWSASINNRSRGHGCPYCTGKSAIPGKTDLATQRLDLVKEWHPTQNGELKPTEVSVYSNKKVYWQCKEGHEWQATVGVRASGHDCPYCTGRSAIPGKTDLATLRPDLAKEWNLIRNGELKASEVGVYSNKKVYWQCDAGHEWRATVSNRSCGKGCPQCCGQRSSKRNKLCKK